MPKVLIIFFHLQYQDQYANSDHFLRQNSVTIESKAIFLDDMS